MAAEITITKIKEISEKQIEGVKRIFDKKFPDLIWENSLDRITKATRLDQTHIDQFFIDRTLLCRTVAMVNDTGKIFIEFFEPKEQNTPH